MGSFLPDYSCYIKQLTYLTQAHGLAWHNLFITMSSTLTSDEEDLILTSTRAEADGVHLAENSLPVGAEAVPTKLELPGRSLCPEEKDHMV